MMYLDRNCISLLSPRPAELTNQADLRTTTIVRDGRLPRVMVDIDPDGTITQSNWLKLVTS